MEPCISDTLHIISGALRIPAERLFKTSIYMSICMSIYMSWKEPVLESLYICLGLGQARPWDGVCVPPLTRGVSMSRTNRLPLIPGCCVVDVGPVVRPHGDQRTR